jgi:hypothetical protein
MVPRDTLLAWLRWLPKLLVMVGRGENTVEALLVDPLFFLLMGGRVNRVILRDDVPSLHF